MTSLEDIFPPFALRVSCGPLTLSTLLDGDIPGLVDAVLDGVQADEGPMPFLLPWHLADPTDLPINMACFYWEQRAAFTAQSWHLMLVVRHADFGDRPLGVQDVLAPKSFYLTRVAKSGSWLARQFHGRGIGTLMRQTMATFLFDELKAEALESSYLEGNHASRAVSNKTGYQEVADPTARVTREDGWITEHRVVVTPDTLVRPPYTVRYSGVPALRCFIGLDAHA